MLKKLGVLCFCLFAAFIHQYKRLPGDVDEVRYLEVTREMAEQNSWIIPLYNYEPYAHKPPLFFWLLYTIHKALPLGITASSLLLVSLTTGGVLLFFYKMLSLVGEGHLFPQAAIFLSTSFLFAAMGRVIRMDMLLCFWVVMGLYSYLRSAWNASHPWLWGISMGLGLLTKGPVVFLWLVGIPIIYALAEKKKQLLLPLRHLYPWLIGIGLFLLWLIPALFIGPPDYQKELLFAQTFARVGGALGHPEPWYYYLLTLPAGMLPWITIAIPGFIALGKEKNPTRTFLFTWIFFPLLAFSLMNSKMVIYLLPLSLPFAWVASKGWHSASKKGTLAISLVLIALIAAGLGIAGKPYALPFLTWFLPFAASLFFLCLHFWKPSWALWGMGGILLYWFAFPVENLWGDIVAKNTPYAVAQSFQQLYPQAMPAVYRELRPSFLFVWKQKARVIENKEELRTLLFGKRAFPFIITEWRYLQLPFDLRERLIEKDRLELLRTTWLIVEPTLPQEEKIPNQEEETDSVE